MGSRRHLSSSEAGRIPAIVLTLRQHVLIPSSSLLIGYASPPSSSLFGSVSCIRPHRLPFGITPDPALVLVPGLRTPSCAHPVAWTHLSSPSTPARGRRR
ncbi:hypothetical protein HGRIS_008829 [Hohenbuehelia grisea]|uniref:Uncharacterized protein n=1 Tax=Hohenbuehelia grisea TaxID=104357 RepID=A0ABR3IZ94_9AGAR